MNGGPSISGKSQSFRYNSCKLWLFFLVSPFSISSSFLLPPTFLPLLSPQLFSGWNVYQAADVRLTSLWSGDFPEESSKRCGLSCPQMGLPLGLWASRDMGLIWSVWPQRSWSSVWEWIWILCSPVSMFGKQLCCSRLCTALAETSGMLCLVGCWDILDGPDSAACCSPWSP